MNIYFHCVCAFVLRIGFLLYGHLQDVYSDVKFTDIDYQIFSDATAYVWKGESPFKRHTYRYSLVLSYMLIPNLIIHPDFGKILFCFFDILTSLLIHLIQKKCGFSDEVSKKCAFLWLYNPMVMVISTRGSSDSVMTFLIMLLILFYIKNKILSAGLVYGFSVHMKIYPCIYAATFYFMLSKFSDKLSTSWGKLRHLLHPTHGKIVFVFSSALGFLLPTLVSVYLYETDYINEAFLYHLKRKDVRHNFSPYFYFLYLSDTLNPFLASVVSFSSFLIQIFLIGLISWKFTLPQLLPSCLFVETFIFVTFNKVCTSQYFLWYLCIFPLCYPLVSNHKKEVAFAFAVWLLGQVVWLIPAYYLEFKGYNSFFYIFLASLFFFVINVSLILMYVKMIMKPKLSFTKQAKIQ